MIIGICGGTGSGKTTVAHKIVSSIGETYAVCLPQDAYYRDLGEMPLDLRSEVNFDHPDAFDGELLLSHLEALHSGKGIDRPVYDFTTHTRRTETIRIEPLPAILLEGILIFADARMRRLMDLKIFIDCADDIRILRRLERDMRERGRSAKSVMDQYRNSVLPMHLQFVAPTRRYADILIPEGGIHETDIDVVVEKIRSFLMQP